MPRPMLFLSVALHLTILGYKRHLLPVPAESCFPARGFALGLPVPGNATIWAQEPVKTLVVPVDTP